MSLYTKQHYTEKIPTSRGRFIGLPKDLSTRNLEVGDYFFISPSNPNLLVFIQGNWENVWFLGVGNNKVCHEIEYNVLTDSTSIIESNEQFTNLYNQEISNLKQQIL
jgi:hypothetical protein